jgi:prepilin-type N-terminal cleavage/methylation domain-containing protein
MRQGTTVPELIVVIMVLGVLASVAITRTTAIRDRMSVRSGLSSLNAIWRG